jgi:DNA-binding SARP family transcriptional activator
MARWHPANTAVEPAYPAASVKALRSGGLFGDAEDPVAAETEFCVLGPLVVRQHGVIVPVPPGKQQALLAALLLSAGQPVPADTLAETLWGAGPPRSARASLQNHVMRLRKSLAVTGDARIGTRPGGYQISLESGELDLHRFESSLSAAREAARAGSWAAAAERYRAALSLWRGQPLSGVPSDTLALREVPRLAEMRLQALEARIDADLHLGRHAETVSELRQLAAAHPLRERLAALLMLALYQCGQQADALAAYQTARTVLINELGAEPGPELRKLQRRILAADPALTPRDAVRRAGGLGGGGLGGQVPMQLPGAPAHFVGRGAELAALDGMIGDADGSGQAAMISVIAGTAGVGKTALAVYWAHRVADRFPDGQLYVDLRGYDAGQPVPAADALARLLASLGVAGRDMPAETDERAGRFRSLLAGRRILLLLDNAGSAEQVRPLLPGTAGCLAVVTSRDSLVGLIARDGGRRLPLDLLQPGEATDLLRALIGDRVDAEPAAAAALAERCVWLPLALRVAAEIAVARPSASLADLAGELGDLQRRLDLLDAAADPRTAIRAVFSWSCRNLDAAAARTFRLLALHPGADFDVYAVAALTATTAVQAAALLGQLAHAHLVQSTGPARYGMHDLLRAYALEQSARDDSDADRQAALTRLFDYYVHTAATAMDVLFPAEQQHRPRVPSSPAPVPELAGPAAARDWLDAQRGNLVAAAVHAADAWPAHTTGLAATLFRYLDEGGYHAEAAAIHGHALTAARHAGDRVAEAAALTNLGMIDVWQGRNEQAADHFEHAAAACHDIGDRTGEARALGNLGCLDQRRGRYRQAVGRIERALALFRELADRYGEACALGNLADVGRRLGRYEEAIGQLEDCLALCREAGDETGGAYALVLLGDVYRRQGRREQAASHLERALALCRNTGNRTSEAYALTCLGEIARDQDDYRLASSHMERALAVFRDTGNRSGEAEALNGLGGVLFAAGETPRARAAYTAALGLASQVDDQQQRARALGGLGDVDQASGHASQARQNWRQALAIYADLEVPEAGQVGARLSASGGSGAPSSPGGSGAPPASRQPVG